MKNKRLLFSLAAALLITSVIGFNSCTKTPKNGEDPEWVPTTYTFVSDSTRPDLECPYCAYPVNLCAHGWNWSYYGDPCPVGAYDPETNPLGHYHVHWFDATGPNSDCRPPITSPFYSSYYCPYRGVRAHRHVVVWWENGIPNYPHVGGGGN